jgi:hypothetical protein
LASKLALFEPSSQIPPDIPKSPPKLRAPERTYRLLSDLENATPKDEEELLKLLSQYNSK